MMLAEFGSAGLFEMSWFQALVERKDLRAVKTRARTELRRWLRHRRIIGWTTTNGPMPMRTRLLDWHGQ
jgi:hypothetical protein